MSSKKGELGYETKLKLKCKDFLKKSLMSVNEKMNSLDSFVLFDKNLEEKIELISTTLKNYVFLLNKLFPKDQNFIEVISHNDIHPANILLHQSENYKFTKSFNSFKLIDYEFANFNYLGFDIVNYLVETFFNLYYKDYPFYKITKDPMEIFTNSFYYKVYCRFIDFLFIYKGSFLGDITKEELLDKKYFSKLVALSSLFWFLIANVQLKFDTWKEKKSFDYLLYGVDRLQFYLIAKEKFNL